MPPGRLVPLRASASSRERSSTQIQISFASLIPLRYSLLVNKLIGLLAATVDLSLPTDMNIVTLAPPMGFTN